MAIEEVLEQKIPRITIIFYTFLVLLIISAGLVFYNSQSSQITSSINNELQSIAKLKIGQISWWRNERLEDAYSIISNQILMEEIYRLSKNLNKNHDNKKKILQWINSFKNKEEYNEILLIDSELNILISSISGDYIGQHAKELLIEIKKIGKPLFSDLHTSQHVNYIHIDLGIPLYSDASHKNLFGFLLCRIDPSKFLYPLIQTWPIPSKSAETIILRKENDSIVYLNELRHKPNSAFKLKFSINEKNLPAARVVAGVRGIFEGKDYLGNKVISFLAEIPGTNWFMVNKVDKDEVFYLLRFRTILIIIIIFLLLFIVGIVIWLNWKGQNLQYYKQLLEKEKEKKAIEKSFEYISKYANDIIFLLDDQLNIKYCNEKGISTYEYSSDELLKKNIIDLRSEKEKPKAEQQYGLALSGKGTTFTTEHTTKNGKEFPVEVSAKLIEIEGKYFINSIVRDITERKKFEAEILKLNRVYLVLSNINQVIVRQRDREQLLKEVCRIIVEDGKFLCAWIGLMDNSNYQILECYGLAKEKIEKEIISVIQNDLNNSISKSLIENHSKIIVNYLQKELQNKNWIESALRLGIKSFVGYYLRLSSSEEGVIYIYSKEENFFSKSEMKLIDELIDDLSYALTSIENEKILRENQLKIKNIFENSQDVFYSHRVDHIPNYVSPQIKKVLGYDVEEAMIKWTDFLSDNPSNQIGINMTNKAIETGIAQKPYELELIHKTGKKVWVEVREAPIVENGKTIEIVGSFSDITYKKATEKALIESEKKFRDTIAYLDEGYYSVTLEGILLDHNRAFNRIFGYSEDKDLRGTYLQDFWLYPEERNKYLKELSNGSLNNFHVNAKTKDGTPINVIVSAHIVYNDKKNPERIEGVFSDITDLLDIQKQLIIEKEWSEKIINSASSIIVALDKEAKICLFNKYAEELTGYKAEEVLGKNWISTFIPTELQKDINTVWYEIVEKKLIGHQHENIILTKNGDELLIRWNNAVVIEDDEFKMILSVGEDITERKKIEDKLKESEENFRTIIESAPVGIIMSDINDKTLFVNNKFIELTGYTKEDYSSINEWWNVAYPDELYRGQIKEKWEGSVKEAIKNNSSIAPIESMVKCKDGTTKFFETGFVNVKQFNIITFVDITKRKEAEKEITEINEELELRVKQRTEMLEQANKELESFSYSVSHDLRAPLRAISGFSNILVSDYKKDLPSEAQTLLTDIVNNAKKMSQLIDDLLEFSRIIRKDFKKSSIDMNELFKNCFNELLQTTKNKNIKFNEMKLPEGYGDEHLIKQVVTNLLSNAIKFSSKKTNPEIIIEGVSMTNENIYSITDNGEGFDMRYYNKLFGVFQRLHRQDEFEGTGVGLAIVSRIVQRHGGKVWAESEIGKGTTFYFSLPNHGEIN